MRWWWQQLRENPGLTLRVLVNPPWRCRLTRRHQLVPRIPFCFRCMAKWDSWEDVSR